MPTLERIARGEENQTEFSILIPSLVDRKEKRDELTRFIMGQAAGTRLELAVEILTLTDSGSWTTGKKRNDLLGAANGAFLAFVDDDDWVSDNYVEEVIVAIRSNPNLDCLGIVGIISTNGMERRFVHSVAVRTWHEMNGIYYRPPNHLNPIRASIAKQFK